MRIDEIDRRGFLKGVSAATLGASGMTNAAPFNHGDVTDQMTDKVVNKFSKVKSDNGDATLELHYAGKKKMLVLVIPGSTIRFGSVHGTAGRIKFGDGPVSDLYFSRPSDGSYSWAGAIDDQYSNSGIVNKVLKHSGQLKIEIPIYKEGNRVFSFTIEQDSTTKSVANQPSNKTPDKKDTKTLQHKTQDEPTQTYMSPYSMRVAARIKPNIVYNYSEKPNSNVVVEIDAEDSGKITSSRIVKSSGDSNFDNAVKRAVDKTQVIPRDVDGKIPTNLRIEITP